MTEIPIKLRAMSNSYGFLIPKALVDCKVLQPGKKYVAIIKEVSPKDAGLEISSPKLFFKGFPAFAVGSSGNMQLNL